MSSNKLVLILTPCRLPSGNIEMLEKQFSKNDLIYCCPHTYLYRLQVVTFLTPKRCDLHGGLRARLSIEIEKILKHVY